jgi:terminase small subunit-like protein
MRKIAAIEGMPSVKTQCRWIAEKPKFRQLRAEAKAAFIEADIEEAREIVDDSLYDWKEQELASGQTVVVGDHEHIARSKMRVEFRLKHAAMLAPQKYGAKIDMKHSGQVSTVVRYHKPERKKP